MQCVSSNTLVGLSNMMLKHKSGSDCYDFTMSSDCGSVKMTGIMGYFDSNYANRIRFIFLLQVQSGKNEVH